MSRIGKLPVEGGKATLSLADGVLTAKGPKGELTLTVVDDVNAEVSDNSVTFTPKDESKRARAMWGTMRARAQNMVIGVTEGYEKELELVGVGYRAQMQGSDVKLSLGFSHDVIYKAPEGISLSSTKPTEVKIAGADKQAVGQVAAEIRKYRPPEPYKGKGIRYAGEQVRRKEGKKK
ncbi:50S ribosomal protein L6 [Ponticaulis sp.]|jgi:large subunit ribosomal protein L6|uniref:50S ribosomal protein L6 n=1 Tax=Ponticaulis sp. TaxID=2020902 RepID=UPI000C56A5D9|nr:50S ribosomal protein L6 [Ponticaulis sp.]MAF58301.1 50S ribosomal protein L6 [Ponticaulis sp.]MBN04292.1 50S ribosomal protein L6 [Ponticaulis sp.]